MRRLALLLATGAAAVALTSPAGAGGFQRGVADTDILFEKGTFSSRYSLTYVHPNRGFSSINGVKGDFGDYTGDYTVPNASVAFGNDDAACAGTYTISFAAESDYEGGLPRQVSSTMSTDNDDRLNFLSAGSTSQTVGSEFESNEWGATCRISYSTEKSRYSFIGGLFVEDFNFNGQSLGERNLNPLFPAGLVGALGGARITLPTAVDVDTDADYGVGYRLGLAYEMPEIALRAQVLYRSEVKHDDIRGDGSVTITDSAFLTLPSGAQVAIPTAFGPAINGALTGAGLTAGRVIPVVSTFSEATSPQFVTVNLQTGIAPGTLLLGSFRWTDWSTNNSAVSTIYLPDGSFSSSYSPYHWDDGYTASIGIGRAFNEQIAGVISLGYDRGVSTGAETTYTDLYTVSGGISLKPSSWGEIRVGGLIGYWTDGEQKISDGAYFDGTVDDTIVYAGSASLKISF